MPEQHRVSCAGYLGGRVLVLARVRCADERVERVPAVRGREPVLPGGCCVLDVPRLFRDDGRWVVRAVAVLVPAGVYWDDVRGVRGWDVQERVWGRSVHAVPCGDVFGGDWAERVVGLQALRGRFVFCKRGG